MSITGRVILGLWVASCLIVVLPSPSTFGQRSYGFGLQPPIHSGLSRKFNDNYQFVYEHRNNSRTGHRNNHYIGSRNFHTSFIGSSAPSPIRYDGQIEHDRADTIQRLSFKPSSDRYHKFPVSGP